jgi:hypothetical protein
MEWVSAIRFLSATQNQKLNLVVLQTRMKYALAQGKVDDAVAFAHVLEGALDDYHRDLAFRTDVTFSVTVAYVLGKHYKEALSTLNRLINSEAVYGKQRVYEAYVRMMEIIVHAELGNTDFIKNRVRSLRYFFKTNQSGYQTEALLLKYIRQISREKEAAVQRQLYSQLLGEVEAVLESSPLEQNFYHHFDLAAWVRSKLEA